MNRKLTDKETDFLLELRDLMAKHNAIVFAEDGRVCFDVEYSDVDDPVEPVMLPEGLTVYYEIDEFIQQNSYPLQDMKTWRTIQKIAVAVGMTYGMWLGTNVDATDADSRNAFVIIVLSVIVAISLCMPDKTDIETA